MGDTHCCQELERIGHFLRGKIRVQRISFGTQKTNQKFGFWILSLMFRQRVLWELWWYFPSWTQLMIMIQVSEWGDAGCNASSPQLVLYNVEIELQRKSLVEVNELW